MELSLELTSMDAEALRNLTATLLVQLADKDAVTIACIPTQSSSALVANPLIRTR